MALVSLDLGTIGQVEPIDSTAIGTFGAFRTAASTETIVEYPDAATVFYLDNIIACNDGALGSEFSVIHECALGNRTYIIKDKTVASEATEVVRMKLVVGSRAKLIIDAPSQIHVKINGVYFSREYEP